ncbi:unnamed protein product [Caenorhabditis angaria]|uniref:Uncharacterized protein n=1 Tax=Caenorhabditis angaria TaxID=860376 RepID=A0A9P1J6P4_9PELO|nr:unnamed protein product [Caenorhabditis angaria]
MFFAILIFANIFDLVFSHYGSTTKYCYSCMSEDFSLHWPYLEEVYHRPMNFTDKCFQVPTSANIGKRECTQSTCVTVIEPRILAGQHIGNNIIRGCFESVFKFGSTPRTGQTYDTSCMRMPAHKLLPPRLAARSSNRTVELCWCIGQLCNNYPSVAMNSVRQPNFFFFSSFLALFLVFVLLWICG